MFNKNIALLMCVYTLLLTQQLAANVVWPELFMYDPMDYKIWVLIIISILIEALAFFIYLKDISYIKALSISLVGNTTSSLIGLYTDINSIAAFPSIIFFQLLLGKYLSGYMYYLLYIGISLTTMYLTSVLIELFVITLVFRYPAKKLWIPILLGNFITYAIIPLFYYFVMKSPLRF